jgi:phenylpropionate dioxygenase-like ring-hydroxylating dioxygenase large terminal subunit
MQKPTQLALLDRVLAMIAQQSVGSSAPQTSIDALRYVSLERHEKERALFLRTPLILGRESDAPTAGSFFTTEVGGVPILVARDEQGQLRAFLNVCRHRGSVLCTDPCGQRKAFVCLYHGWAYELSGALMNVPLRATFPTLRDADYGLIALPIATLHGFVFVTPTPDGAPPQLDLGEFAADLDALQLSDHVAYKRATLDRACNWKLVVDAFLEGYHVKSLHRTSIARFFRDDGVVVDFVGPHARSIGARRDFETDLHSKPRDAWNIREVATVYYFLFPSSILVCHPDWISHITVQPLTADRCRCVHTMLIAKPPESDTERAHFDRSWDLIHGQVFAQEDLSITESVQRGLSAFPAQQCPLGALEYPIAHFHHCLDDRLSAMTTPARPATKTP